MTGTTRRRYCSDACGQKALGKRRAEQQDIHMRATRDLPGLRHWCDRHVELGGAILGRIVVDTNDLRPLVSAFFLARQIDAMRSLLVLGISRDMRLIARSMLEGAAQFTWMAKDFETRAIRWERYRWVAAYRSLRARRLAGEEVDPALDARIQGQLDAFGADFYSGEDRKAIDRGKTPPSFQYDDNWSGKNIRAIFAEVEHDGNPMWATYDELYKEFSNWQHWNAGGWDDGMGADQDGRFVYTAGNPADASTALRTGMFTLWTTMMVVVLHFFPDDGNLIAALDSLGRESAAWWKQACLTAIDTA